MTPGEVLIPGAVAIVFVVTWFVFGLIDATRRDSHRQDVPKTGTGPIPQPIPQPIRPPVRHSAGTHRR